MSSQLVATPRYVRFGLLRIPTRVLAIEHLLFRLLEAGFSPPRTTAAQSKSAERRRRRARGLPRAAPRRSLAMSAQPPAALSNPDSRSGIVQGPRGDRASSPMMLRPPRGPAVVTMSKARDRSHYREPGPRACDSSTSPRSSRPSPPHCSPRRARPLASSMTAERRRGARSPRERPCSKRSARRSR